MQEHFGSIKPELSVTNTQLRTIYIHGVSRIGTIDIIYTHRDSLGEIRYRHDFTTLLMSSLDFQSGFFIHIHLNHSSSWPSADVEISLCGILTLLICGLFNL
jgi:hypothetical protein